jgi:hypothetical protein
LSFIDTSMDPILQESMLDEVRGALPAFLGSASREQTDPVSAAAELLGLSVVDMKRVVAVHVMLSEPIRALVQALPAGLRRPMTSTVRPRQFSRSISAGIDWKASIAHRATASPLGDVWVTRPARRAFDLPENRALAWVLETVEGRGRVAVRSDHGNSPWAEEIRAMSAAVHAARHVSWVEALDSAWPGDDVYRGLRGDRLGFYKNRVAESARHLRSILVDPSASDLAEAICARYFVPERDWQLFEIAVLLRICRALAANGDLIGNYRLLVGAPGPFAKFRISSSVEVRVWYQHWPASMVPSELEDAAKHYGVGQTVSRPDIVIEILSDSAPVKAIVLELKASSSAKYLSSGLSQLLGYLRDRPNLTSGPATGWLVAPASTSFTTRAPEGRALWVVSSDEVANEVLRSVRL